ncbi:MAG: hypothetical protein INR73_17330 [Williamsia sp.]|nr:hypothetical protein [Williamsia sp.]
MTLNKSQWGNGEWQNEPDELIWEDSETGYSCQIYRNKFGCFCGYVGIGIEHPFFGQKYFNDLIMQADIHVHGGLTFSGELEDGDDEWYFGFAAMDDQDCLPAFENLGGVYRNLQFMKDECRRLCNQLASYEKIS